MFSLLLLPVLLAAACEKAYQPPTYIETDGVKVETPKLQAVFASAPTYDQKAAVAQVAEGVRYRQYDKALAALEALSNDATLTPEQKKVVEEVTGQVKQAASKAAARAPK